MRSKEQPDVSRTLLQAPATHHLCRDPDHPERLKIGPHVLLAGPQGGTWGPALNRPLKKVETGEVESWVVDGL